MTARLRDACRLALVLLLAGGAAHAHEGHDHEDAPPVPVSINAAGGKVLRATRLPDGTVFMPKPAQFQLGLKSVLAAGGKAGDFLKLPGVVIPDPGNSARVASVERGLFRPASPELFRLGTRVKQGQVLGYVEPLVEEADLIRRRAEMAQTQQELIINDQAQLQLGMQLKGQPGMNTTTIYYDNLIRDRDRLKVRLAELKESVSGTIKLISPVSGEISEAVTSSGMLVEQGQTVFEVVEPDRLWVEAQSYESLDPHAIAGAEARTADGTVYPLHFIGQNLSTVGQSRAMEFELRADAPRLHVGERVDLALRLGESAGVVLPRKSVTQGADGRTSLWVQTGAERFSPRQVKVESLPDDRVRVLEGVSPHERIVVEGGWLLGQVR